MASAAPAPPAPLAPGQPEDTESPSTPGPTPEVSLKDKFVDFDDKKHYERAKIKALDENARNFVVEFGPDHSRIAWNLDLANFQQLLRETRNTTKYPVRWINVWNSDHVDGDAAGFIHAIGKQYRFSTRLTTSIQSWDRIKPEVRALKRRAEKDERPYQGIKAALGLKPRGDQDLEQGPVPATFANRVSLNQTRVSKDTRAEPKRPNPISPKELEAYKLTHDSLNYTTIDQVANRFICIGANWLHLLPTHDIEKSKAGAGSDPPLIPPKHWAWYALCSDKLPQPDTVVTFHEAPYYHGKGKGKSHGDELRNMRSTVRKCLLQLSKHGIPEYKDKIFEIAAIRKQLQDHDLDHGLDFGDSRTSFPLHKVESDATSPIYLEGASNLFYYLFDEYSAVIPILNQSKERLEQLAHRILHPPSHADYRMDSKIIPSLYSINRELRQLKHLFQGYKMLFLRILAYANQGSEVPRLASTACDRFERLNDRLELLMLDTIDEYLEEKDSLSNTYFNLTAQRDSQATARLTRSATLLAKLSVFFLPISFITAFFSIQVPGVLDGYNQNTYWGVFGVTVFLSFLALFFFSRLLMSISVMLDDVSSGVWVRVIESCRGVTRRLVGKGKRGYMGEAVDSDPATGEKE